MNEFAIKKLAEVQAFINLSSLIVTKAGERFKTEAPLSYSTLGLLNVGLLQLVDEDNDDERSIFTAKVNRTDNKLSQMMELYIGDEWNNPVEVLEWLSFYSGAGAAHASLVTTLLGKYDDHRGQHLVADIMLNFQKLLECIKVELPEIGLNR